MAIAERQFRAQMACWPGLGLDIKWRHRLAACIDRRMFAVFDPGDADAGHLHFKVEDELFLALTEQPGIVASTYLARAHWVSVIEPSRYPLGWYRQRLRRAYELVTTARLSKKRQRELGLPV